MALFTYELMKNTIECAVCGKSFKQITVQHLKTHDITTADYKLKYGNLYPEGLRHRMGEMAKKLHIGSKRSPETRERISKSKKGKPAHNKGDVHTDETKRVISEKAKDRLKDKTNHPMYGRHHHQNTKDKLSEAQSEYAKNNPHIMSERAKRGVKAREANGHTPLHLEASSKRSEQSYIDGARKSNKVKSHNAMLAKIRALPSLGLELAEGFYPHAGKSIWKVKCTKCDMVASRHSQMFDPYRIKDNIDCFGLCTPQGRSSHELDLGKSLDELGVSYEIGNRQLISPQEVDFYIPNKSLAIEMCGLYWHGELHASFGKGKHRTYHRDKYAGLKDQNISLITIFEDEWVHNRELVIQMLTMRLGVSSIATIGARNCQIKEIDTKLAKPFLEANHISGYARSTIKYGLFMEDELVSVMTFSMGEVSRKNMGTWEISRFASKMGWRINGAASRLFKQFVKHQDPEYVISYADLRWGEGNVYKHLGFERLDDTVPNYWYYPMNCYPLKRHHRYTLRKNSEDDASKTEWENRQEQGWNRIWDCGNAKWSWSR